MHTHTKESLLIVTLAMTCVAVLSVLQWGRTDRHTIIGSSTYEPLHEAAGLYTVLPPPPGPPLPARSGQTASTARYVRSALQRRQDRITRQQQTTIPRFIGPYSTEGLTPAQIEILRQQCGTGVRDCR